MVDFLSLFKGLSDGRDAVVEHERKDQIRKDVTEVVDIEEGIASIRSEGLDLSILAHDDESSQDHQQDWDEPYSDSDDLQWFGLRYALEWKSSPRDKEKTEPELESIQDSHIGEKFGEGFASHDALGDGDSEQVDGYGHSRKQFPSLSV